MVTKAQLARMKRNSAAVRRTSTITGTTRARARRGLLKAARGIRASQRRAIKNTALAAAKSVLADASPLKFFNVAGAGTVTPQQIQTGASMYCEGFAVGHNRDLASGSLYQYGTGTMRKGEIGRVYVEGAGSGLEHPDNNLEGRSLYPSKCSTKMCITRDWTDEATESVHSYLPWFYRVIRVRPKWQGSGYPDQYPNPTLDLFIKPEVGSKCGVSTTGFDNNHLMFCDINTKQYTVLNDMKFTLSPPADTASALVGAAKTSAANQNQSYKFMQFDHDIGKKLTYNTDSVEQPEDHDARSHPKTGFKQEFILVHACFIDANSQSEASAGDWHTEVSYQGTFREIGSI